MKQMLLQEKYPVFTLELNKDETYHNTMDGIVDYFLVRIHEHHIAEFIALFDHYSHTKALSQGEINPEIIAAQNIIFCFGTNLPNPQVLAIRPRSIGIAEFNDKFVISFMETPMPMANQAMETWAKDLLISKP